MGCGMSSKEIAQQTGLAPQTVDTYLKAAMARLGATNRREAARMLSNWEISQKSGSLMEPIAAHRSVAQQLVAANGQRWADWLSPPRVGGSRNDLTAAGKTYAVLTVAAIGAAGVIAIALLIAGAFQIFR